MRFHLSQPACKLIFFFSGKKIEGLLIRARVTLAEGLSWHPSEKMACFHKEQGYPADWGKETRVNICA